MDSWNALSWYRKKRSRSRWQDGQNYVLAVQRRANLDCWLAQCPDKEVDARNFPALKESLFQAFQINTRLLANSTRARLSFMRPRCLKVLAFLYNAPADGGEWEKRACGVAVQSNAVCNGGEAGARLLQCCGGEVEEGC